ncbi:hypothetical protein DL96DRAFT_1824483 [Flagelloscypha sp. PMI_526]|nr:hypothetical protein DL96DRAFT_1824483 [Flagelloscypha sp. PMI_526]
MSSSDEDSISSLDQLLHKGQGSYSRKSIAASFYSRWRNLPYRKTLFVLHAFNFLLHTLLVILHLALVMVMLNQWERRVVVGIGQDSARWTLGIRIGLQAFAITYLALLLYLTQKLALRRSLSQLSTLTSSHDRYAAWLGLGNAFQSLLSQWTVNSGVGSILLIVVYLAGCAVVKITTPALLDLVPMYQAVATTATTTSESSLIGLDSLGYPHDWAERAAALTEMTDSIAPHLLVSVQGMLNASQGMLGASPRMVNTSGLVGNVVYELPKLSDVVITASVNAYVTNVTCGYVAFEDQSRIFSSDYYWPEMQSGRASWLSTIGPVNRSASNDLDLIVFWSSFNISDSSGYKASRRLREMVPLRPEGIDYTSLGSNQRFPQVYLPESTSHTFKTNVLGQAWTNWDDEEGFTSSDNSYQLVGCVSWVEEHNITVNGDSGQPDRFPERKSSSTWNQATKVSFPSGAGTEKGFDFDHPVNDLSWMFSTAGTANAGDDFRVRRNVQSPSVTQVALSPSEFWLRKRLKLHVMTKPHSLGTDQLPNYPEPQETILLHDLENALEDYLALALWSMAQSRVNQNNQKNFAVFAHSIVYELRLSQVPVYVGLGATVILLISCFFLVGVSRVRRSEVDDLGLLEILWLSEAVPELMQVDQPRLTELRRSGMVEVRLGENLIRSRAHQKDVDLETLD